MIRNVRKCENTGLQRSSAHQREETEDTEDWEVRMEKARLAVEEERRAKAGSSKRPEEEDEEDEDGACWGCTSRKVECVRPG